MSQQVVDKRGVLDVNEDLSVRLRRLTTDAREVKRVQDRVADILAKGDRSLKKATGGNPHALRKIADSIGSSLLTQTNRLNEYADQIKANLDQLELDIQRFMVLSQDPTGMLTAMTGLGVIADTWRDSHKATSELANLRMTQKWIEGFEGYALASDKFATMYRKAARFGSSVLEKRD